MFVPGQNQLLANLSLLLFLRIFRSFVLWFQKELSRNVFHCSVIKDHFSHCRLSQTALLLYHVVFCLSRSFFNFFEVVFVSLLQQLWYLITFNRLLSRTFFILLFLSFENSLYILSFSFKNVKYFFVINNHNGEEGIWTLAPLLTTYSLSRRAPSASWVLLQIVNKTYSKRMYKPMTSYLNRWYGEGGIRTHGTFQYHWFSRPAP